MKNIFFLLLTTISILSCNKKTKEPVFQSSVANLDVFRVKVADVSTNSGPVQITANGVLVSDLESKPGFKTGGVIDHVYFKEGDKVNQGQLLATLQMVEINAQVDQARKSVEKTTRDLARVKNLHADSVATLEQLQNVQTAYDVSIETFKIAEFNQSYSKVTAPISGTVVKKIMGIGEIVGPGMPVCAIMGTGSSHWVIKAAVSDKEWARIKKGDKAEVKFEAFPGSVMEGVVDKIAEISNPGTATLDIEIKLTKPSPTLAAGLISTVIISPKNNAFAGSKYFIPIEALVSSNGGNGIVYIPQEGKAMKKMVAIDKLSGDNVSISNGLEGIKQVITAGAVYLQDGDKIEIIK
ncbi:MAG: efflux RND transporter periplasmic adaptor subunit [Saprospiraceae bacterium]